MTRTWTAKIQIGREIIDATLSGSDLLADQTMSAVREAALFVDESTEAVHVELWKSTKAHGVVRDRVFFVYRDRKGVVRFQ